ncbi:hypothetical protein [Nocardia sp. SC052]|uniref:hypothetical protein n=1 Tax=Nocardia sichangensis TaxID=3385975 RepID=UPI00399FD22B
MSIGSAGLRAGVSVAGVAATPATGTADNVPGSGPACAEPDLRGPEFAEVTLFEYVGADDDSVISVAPATCRRAGSQRTN